MPLSGCFASRFFKISEHPDGIEPEKLYVLPAQKGRGIGQIMINVVINVAREKAKEGLILYGIDTNQAAIRFYEKTHLENPSFKEELKGAWQMAKSLYFFAGLCSKVNVESLRESSLGREID